LDSLKVAFKDIHPVRSKKEEVVEVDARREAASKRRA